MTPLDALLFVAGVIAGLVVLAAVGRLLFGPDRDLQEPWSPGDEPSWAYPPCGSRTCKVDHDRVGAWRERAPR